MAARCGWTPFALCNLEKFPSQAPEITPSMAQESKPPVVSQPPRRSRTCEQLLAEGQALLRSNQALDALRCFEAALQSRPDDPRIMSQYAVLLCQQRGQGRRAMDLATRALELAAEDPDVHINMAHMQLAQGNKNAAVMVLREAAKRFPTHAGIAEFLAGLGKRRQPFVSALPRSHPLNKWVGMLTWRMGLR
jgi:Flp pilus assembly protein TadD